MESTRAVVGLVLFSAGLAACHNLYEIQIAAPAKPGTAALQADPPGIPFLPIVPFDVDTAVYEQRWAKIELTGQLDEEFGGKHLKREVSRVLYSADDADTDTDVGAAMVDEFNRAEVIADAWTAATAEFDGKKGPDKVGTLAVAPPKALGPHDLAAIEALPVLSVDHKQDERPSDQIAYANIQVPFGGTGQGEFDLNENGTLAKGVGQAQDQLPGTVATLLGGVAGSSALANLVTARVGAVGGPGSSLTSSAQGILPTKSKVTTTVLSASIAVTRFHRTYTITLTRPHGERCAGLENLLAANSSKGVDPVVDSSNCHASLDIVVEKADDDSSPAKKKNESPTIAIEGSVTLPTPTPKPKPNGP